MEREGAAPWRDGPGGWNGTADITDLDRPMSLNIKK
jgi:hypothetical protein